MSLPLASTIESPTLMARSMVAIVPVRFRSGMGMFFSMFMLLMFYRGLTMRCSEPGMGAAVSFVSLSVPGR